jgi:hypothetical protein
MMLDIMSTICWRYVQKNVGLVYEQANVILNLRLYTLTKTGIREGAFTFVAPMRALRQSGYYQKRDQ